jgi:predicted nuclease of predicted toxin-antitoxin system
MAQLKLDEHFPAAAAETLSEAGHHAATVLQQELGGTADPDLAAICQREGRALLTLDMGFSDIRSYPPGEYPGLVVLRPASQAKGYLLRLLQRLSPHFDRHPLSGRLWIVDEQSIRIRPAPDWAPTDEPGR